MPATEQRGASDRSFALLRINLGAEPRSRSSPEALTNRTFVRYCSSMSNDRSYLSSLQDYYARHRALPSYASIGQLLGLKSKSSVAAMVARLKLAGFIESTPDKRLAPTARFFARPIAESPIQAGMPDAVDDAHG